MAHLAVNHHYVGMPAMPHDGIHGLGVDDFRDHLERLARTHELVSLDDVLKAVSEDGTLPDDACLITFDDGLRCQFERALPIMDELGVPGAFFVFVAPCREGLAANVHKLQFLRASFGDARILAAVSDLSDEGEIDGRLEDIDTAVARDSYRYDTPEAARLKYFLNYTLTEPVLTQGMDALFAHFGIDERDFVNDLYMTKDMIGEIGARGWLGSHGLSHRPLATLSDADVWRELSESRAYLEHVAGRQILAVSYPLGNKMAVSRGVSELAGRAGYLCGWTMERKRNAGFRDSLMFARIDAADAGGAAFPVRSRYTDETETEIQASP